MVALPGASALTTPVEETVATVESLDSHLMARSSFLPCASSAWALSCEVRPMRTTELFNPLQVSGILARLLRLDTHGMPADVIV